MTYHVLPLSKLRTSSISICITCLSIIGVDAFLSYCLFLDAIKWKSLFLSSKICR